MNLFRQADGANLNIEKLPDGSMAIYDARSKSVHSLNAGATVLWDACSAGATMTQLQDALGRHLGVAVDEDVVLESMERMIALQLIECEQPGFVPPAVGRRSLLSAMGAVLPAVLTLTLADQRAHAQAAGSGGGFETTPVFTTPDFTTTDLFTTTAVFTTGQFTTTAVLTTTTARFTTTVPRTTARFTTAPFTTTVPRTTARFTTTASH